MTTNEQFINSGTSVYHDGILPFPLDNSRPVDWDNVLSNIKMVCKDGYDDVGVPPARSYASFDMYLCHQFMKYFGTKDVVELGCGNSTTFFRSKGLNVHCFSNDVAGYVGKEKELRNGGFVFCDANSEHEITEKVVPAARECDAIFIDCGHTYNISRVYCEKLLQAVKKPVMIHDMLNPSRTVCYPEQIYIWNSLVGNGYDIFALTDMPRRYAEQIDEFLGVKISNQLSPDDWGHGQRWWNFGYSGMYTLFLVPSE